MMNEIQCIKAVQGGDTIRYRELVERYQTGLIIYCENIVKNRQDGEDIAQEAFTKAFQNLANYSPQKAQFSTWIYRIAANLCVDHLRKNKQKSNLGDVESLVSTVDPSLMEQEELSRVRSLVETLEPPKYARVIQAYFWEGKSYDAIAQEFKTTPNTIGTWIRRAKSQLKEQLS